MKLFNILFEAVDDEESTRPAREIKTRHELPTAQHDSKLIQAMLDMLRQKSETSEFFKKESKDIGPFRFIENFINQNEKTFERIMSVAETIKHLGAGRMGSAFDLGDKILKIEIEHGKEKISSGVRGFKAAKALWSKDKKLGACMPMIYDQGTLKYNNQLFNWIIMEKFQPISDEDYELVSAIINEIMLLMSGGSVTSLHKKQVKELGEKLRLSDDWYKKLKACMKALKAADMKDFHAGNIGVRRSTGTLVFFD